MKLLFCKNCGDIFSLTQRYRECHCGSAAGQYDTEIKATIYGEGAVPLGFENSSFATAVKNQPQEGDGRRFTAFVIPKECFTVAHLQPGRGRR